MPAPWVTLLPVAGDVDADQHRCEDSEPQRQQRDFEFGVWSLGLPFVCSLRERDDVDAEVGCAVERSAAGEVCGDEGHEVTGELIASATPS